MGVAKLQNNKMATAQENALEDSTKRSNLEQQLDEIEILQSIYSQPGEFTIENMESYTALKRYLNENQPDQPSPIECTIHLTIENETTTTTTSAIVETEFDIEINCRLSPDYPSTQLPEAHLHSDSLTRDGQDNFNKDLKGFMSTELIPGDVCILSIIEWVRERGQYYYTPPPPHVDCDITIEPNEFCRMWLYMHHIYSKTKRRNILALAGNLNLTGFCLPGKPGVVCVEGDSSQTKEFYDALRRWNWKSITCRKREIVKNVGSIEEERKISGFQEIFFETHGQRSNHMDLGQFRDYLKEKDLEYMFTELFNVSNQ